MPFALRRRGCRVDRDHPGCLEEDPAQVAGELIADHAAAGCGATRRHPRQVKATNFINVRLEAFVLAVVIHELDTNFGDNHSCSPL